MSITLNNSDFQCLQDQLVELKTKNYELAEKNRRSQADFEAAKAKICTLQLKLEEQERDFQVTSTTLRREIEAATTNSSNANEGTKEIKDEDYKAKYKKLLAKAKELQQRYEKSVEIVQQLDIQNKNLNEKVIKLEEENSKLSEDGQTKQAELDSYKKKLQEKLDTAIADYESRLTEERQKHIVDLEAMTVERNSLKDNLDKLKIEVSNRLESQAEERKIHERKGLQIVKELKRQLALEKNRADTIQKRLENLLSEPPIASNADLENRSRLSTSSSTNGNSSSNGNGSRANQDTNSVGSWSFVPVKAKSSNPALNETLSLCSIDSEDRETVQQPCDTKSDGDSIQRVASLADSPTKQNPATKATFTSTTSSSPPTIEQLNDFSPGVLSEESFKFTSDPIPSALYKSSHGNSNGLLDEDQAALVERLTRLQHDKWMLEEKLSYMEQANSSLSEDLANKSDIIKHYFINQAMKANSHINSSSHGDTNSSNFGNLNLYNSNSPRRISFPNNFNHLLAEKPSLKKVVDFLKERSQVSSGESENIAREATKKMQLMLEETLIKCLKLQENLDFVTSELNKLKS